MKKGTGFVKHIWVPILAPLQCVGPGTSLLYINFLIYTVTSNSKNCNKRNEVMQIKQLIYHPAE